MAKKILSLIVGILLLINPVFAQNEVEVEAGITPDSPLWGIDIAIEKIVMLLTLKPEDKANLGLQRANERLAEIQVMIQQNKTQSMNRAEMERNTIINEVERNTAGLSEEHRQFVLERLQKHVDRLNEVKEKAPEQAQIGLETAIEKSSKVLERMRFRQNRLEGR